jgi:anthranilate/para-aminobenzoate synthase component I
MAALPEIAVHTLDRAALGPAQAYARLRSYTPGRPSFLFESLRPDDGAGRYSLIGYRVTRSELLPPGVDAVAAQAEAFEQAAPPERFAQALALGAAGYFGSGVASLWRAVRLFPDEGPAGQFAVGATIVLFDHHEGSVTIAGPATGKRVERCLWELEHGPDPAPLAPVATDAEPAHLGADLGADKLDARAARALPFLAELDRLTLAETFVCPIAQIDPFDAYRALRRESRSAHGYYVDFGEAPMQPAVRLAGVSNVLLHQKRHGDAGTALGPALRAALPHPAAVGSPPGEAARLLRQLEESSRQTWGGAVGYLCPGGASAFVLSDEILVAHGSSFYCTVGVSLRAGESPIGTHARARQAARGRLAALAAAQNSR